MSAPPGERVLTPSRAGLVEAHRGSQGAAERGFASELHWSRTRCPPREAEVPRGRAPSSLLGTQTAAGEEGAKEAGVVVTMWREVPRGQSLGGFAQHPHPGHGPGVGPECLSDAHNGNLPLQVSGRLCDRGRPPPRRRAQLPSPRHFPGGFRRRKELELFPPPPSPAMRGGPPVPPGNRLSSQTAADLKPNELPVPRAGMARELCSKRRLAPPAGPP